MPSFPVCPLMSAPLLSLALDPRHKGALEYSGMGYLKVGQKAQAEAQLAKLQAICAQCEETTDLAKAIAAYKPAH